MMLRDLVGLIRGKEVILSPDYVGTDEFLLRRSVLFVEDNRRISQHSKDGAMLKNLFDTTYTVIKASDETILARLPTEWFMYMLDNHRKSDDGFVEYKCLYKDSESFRLNKSLADVFNYKKLYGNPGNNWVTNHLIYKHILFRKF